MHISWDEFIEWVAPVCVTQCKGKFPERRRTKCMKGCFMNFLSYKKGQGFGSPGAAYTENILLMFLILGIIAVLCYCGFCFIEEKFHTVMTQVQI